MNTIKILTLGCRLNQIESESIGKFFTDCQFKVDMIPITAQSPIDFDIPLCVLNTCTVTQKAEQKARRIIRLMLQKYPKSTVLVTGCYAQLSPEEIKNIDPRIVVIGSQTKSRIISIPQLLRNRLKEDNFDSIEFVQEINDFNDKQKIEKKGFPENSFILSTSSFLSHSRSSLKIQDGCNSSCSYCAIHLARGHSVSIDVQTAIDRVLELESKGFGEVVLTTVNIGQYKGKYKDGYYNFSQLLQALLDNTKDITFRISSIYPEIVDDEFCRVIQDKRVRPHFHISLQSGSNKILKSMNRAYDASLVLNACKKIRQVKEKAFLACDVITGFPGETEDDFKQTLDLCRDCDFTWVHAFPFSERPGTPASDFKNKVPQSISGERCKVLNDFSLQQKLKYIKSFEGKELSAILETVRRPALLSNNLSKFVYHAVTENFIHCEITSDMILDTRKNLKIVITSVNEDKLMKGGEIEAFAHFK
ncbi:MAG: tRNA (N(6)-L-threonylcarbamoyladenosine(37)-C(2))-methylthiotransferase MtaB [Treponema sp.]|nr:tRNA (N(6)-L-threonylcarbamoyladenosine(37)-C(2))-methylthiotransferase MtaB [Treponema sp.]